MDILLKENARYLLWKYGYCCVLEKKRDKRKHELSDDFFLEYIPNAYKGVARLARTYGKRQIDDLLVHAYFFAVHNHDPEDIKLNHKVYVFQVEELVKQEEHVFYKGKIYGKGCGEQTYKVVDLLKEKKYLKGTYIIIHSLFVVDKAPDYVVRLAHEGKVEDLRAWEPFIKKG